MMEGGFTYIIHQVRGFFMQEIFLFEMMIAIFLAILKFIGICIGAAITAIVFLARMLCSLLKNIFKGIIFIIKFIIRKLRSRNAVEPVEDTQQQSDLDQVIFVFKNHNNEQNTSK